MSKPKPSSDRWLFYLPNDASGHEFLNTMKAIMNTGRYSFRARGRMPDHDKVREQYPNARSISVVTDYSVPMGVADMMAIYLIDRYDESRTNELWQQNYDLQKKLNTSECNCEDLLSDLRACTSKKVELEKQVESLENDLQLANIEASYDDLQQEYRPAPLKHSHTVPEALELTDALDKERAESKMHLKWYMDLVKQYKELSRKHENQVKTIQHFQRIEESNNLLKAQVKTYENELHKITPDRDEYKERYESLQQKYNDLSDLLATKIQELYRDSFKRMLQDNGVTIVKLQDRVKQLEEFIQRLEKETAGINCLLQNDMRDLDIPLDDS